MSNMNDILNKLTAKQREELLQQALKKGKKGSEKIQAVSHSGIEYPLSFAQQRLWFLEQIEGQSSLYNIPCVLSLSGNLNYSALENALNKVIERHSILRTYFIEVSGVAQQVIQERLTISIPIIELLSEEELKTAVTIEASLPFDLSKLPLIRAKIFKIEKDKHILVFTMHHIISDSWSLRLLVNEITEMYHYYALAKDYSLPPLPIQYADYSIWQRSALNEKNLETQLEYWRHQLKELPSLLKLPTNKTRPAKQTYSGAFYHFKINNNVLKNIKNYLNENKITLYMFLLSIFNILLHRYSGQNDIVVGTPVANRLNKETENLIGFFINTLVMRNQIQPTSSFKDFVAEVKKNALAAYDHQDIPFDYLVERLKPERSLSHSPLFQIEFSLQNALPQNVQLAQLQAEMIFIDHPVTKFDLTLSFEEKNEELHGLIEYNTDLFEEAFIARIPGHYEALLEDVLKDSNMAVSELNILSSAERTFLLDKLSQNKKTFPIDKTFNILFEEQVMRSQDAIAVIHNQEKLSYRDLYERANQLAHALLEQGVKQGDNIAFYMDRSISYLVAMLASLKIGGVFIPFNPKSNKNRNAETLIRSQPRCILANEIYTAELHLIQQQAPILFIEQIDFSFYPAHNPSIQVGLNDIAYIIYTSGSTGQPKGAMVEHLGMINHLLAKIDALSFNQHDRMAQIAVQTFDVSVWQFLISILTGGTTVILTGESAWEPRQLLTAIARYQITIVETVPSHLDILLNEVEENIADYDLSTLRYMISNGEPMPMKQCKRWFTAFPHIPLMNAYGPTECSDDVTHLCLAEMPDLDMAYLPAGQPISNARIYVLNDFLQPVPIGVIGEIYIGGDCVGRGYFADEERTELSFIKDPFVINSRLYKTGDLARYHENSQLEFIGRRDFQLKIRGFRIEVGDVEAALQKHPAVERCLVMGIKDKKDQMCLVAYVVSQVHPMPSSEMLREFCKKHLADYMVPAYIFLLDEFPLLNNGKIDRNQLPSPTEYELNTDKSYVAPRNEVEQELAKIWSKVIDVEKVGIHDNFFQIGGHSLLAVELISQMKKVLGSNISLQILFEHPTIAEIITATQNEQKG